MTPVEVVETLVTALQSGDLELAANRMSDDFHIVGLAAAPVSKNEFLTMQSQLLAALPDFSYGLSDVLAENGMVKALVQIHGTQLRELSLPELGVQSIPATGLAVELPQTPVTFQVTNEQVNNVQIEEMQGGGLAGLLQQVATELPTDTREADISE